MLVHVPRNRGCMVRFIGKKLQPKCRHTMLVLSTHPDFQKGWLCLNCWQFFHIKEFDKGNYGYGIAAFRTKAMPKRRHNDH